MMPMRCFASFGKLIELDLSHNFLVSLDFLEPLVSLQSLDISHNNIKQWPKESLNLNELVKLDISSNKITDLSGINRVFPKLIVLDISDNQIGNSFQLDGIRELPLLTEIYVKGNPCYSAELCDYLLEIYTNLDVVDDEERLVIPNKRRTRLDSETSIRFDNDPEFKERLDSALSLVDKEFDDNFFNAKIRENQAICQKSLSTISETLSLMNEKMILKRLEIYADSKGVKQLAEKLFNAKVSEPKELEFPGEGDSVKREETVKVIQTGAKTHENSLTSLNEHLNFTKKRPTPRANSTVRTLSSMSRADTKNSNPFRIKTLKGFVKFSDKVQPQLLLQQNERLKEYLRSENLPSN